MTKLLTIAILIMFSLSSHGQASGTIVDAVTREKIPYVNIWVENKSIGTSSDILGQFDLPKIDSNQVIVFSAIGYESKRVQVESGLSIIELKPQAITLGEVMIRPKRKSHELIIGEIKRLKTHEYFACGTMPWMVARYFPFKEVYEKTPFLKTIRLITNSDVKESIFNIRFYEMNTTGGPGNYLYDQNVFGIAKKGKKITEIEISDANIPFPESGLFIAFEWLIIDQNKYEYRYTETSSLKKRNGVSYEPSIGTINSDSDENSWRYVKGEWKKIWELIEKDSAIDNRIYPILDFELTLTN